MKRQRKRRVLAWLLALALLVGNVPVSAFASSVNENTAEQKMQQEQAEEPEAPDESAAQKEKGG